MFRRKKSVNKKQLEHKLYLARETPEPIFDLSDCDIVQVPSGIYSLCKVFLKESLNLQNNQLNSLAGGGDLKDLQNLLVLDISSNQFTSLPEEIYLLKNLQEFYVADNELKKLPVTLCQLSNLRILDLSRNFLKYLPENIGHMANLQKLLIVGNRHLKTLPKGIIKPRRLDLIKLESENFIYPPAHTAAEGTESIIKFICEDVGSQYTPPSETLINTAEKPTEKLSFEETDSVQAQLWDLGVRKQRKVKEFLELEKNNEIAQQQELELATVSKINKKKLLASITQQQNQLDSKLLKLQKEKEVERFKLIEQLQESENNADIAISKLLVFNKEPLTQLLEYEQEEEARLLEAVHRYNETLRKDDILTAMEGLLLQETEMFDQFDKNREEASRSILEQELENDSRIAQILKDQDTQKSELVTKLIEDCDIQKAAVGTLLERSDARSWGLMQQVRLVESQLAALTHIELDRRKLKMDEHLNDLAEKRSNLSSLLMELLDQQKERRAQLVNTLKFLEEQNSDHVEDFWLRQYQRLLDKLPEGLSQAQRNIDPKLSEYLLMNGVFHCVPFLARLIQCHANKKSITELDLYEAGITNELDREKILDALNMYSKEYISREAMPSAPALDNETPSAPLDDQEIRTISSVECVICMDLECHIIFVPCGHLCCCSDCSTQVNECPLCRTLIKKKIRLVI